MRNLKYEKTVSCYCLKIRRSAAVITNYYDDVLSACGITARQYSLLYNIGTAEQCSVRELSDVTELDRSTLARGLKPLYRQNLIADKKQNGKRNCCLELTQSGKETVERATLLWNTAQENIRQKLGDDGIMWIDKISNLLETL